MNPASQPQSGPLSAQRATPVETRPDNSSSLLSALNPEPSADADRLTCLVMREALVARQYGSQSMTAVLRPDPETELVLHFFQRDGHLEATVRCERGDLPQLRSLWRHVQDALAVQRVEISPLEPPSLMLDEGTGSQTFPCLSIYKAPRTALAEERRLPGSANSESSHIRRRPKSRTRLTGARPGWETWA